MYVDDARAVWRGTLATGFEGTRQTIDMMRDLVRRYRRHPRLRTLAVSIVSMCRAKDFLGEAQAIFDWVRSRIRYVRDPRGSETLHTPDALLDIGSGDCDDLSVLLAALLESIGHRTRFVTVGPSRDAFRHVYVEVAIPSPDGVRWMALDATVDQPAGWRPPHQPVRYRWEI